MANPNKRRGTAFETSVTGLIRERLGPEVECFRPAQAGSLDVGDIHLFGDFILQCKDWASWSKQNVYNFVDDANKQAGHASRDRGVVVIKRRRGKGSSGALGSSLVVLDLDTFIEILDELRYYRDLSAIDAQTSALDDWSDASLSFFGDDVPAP